MTPECDTIGATARACNSKSGLPSPPAVALSEGHSLKGESMPEYAPAFQFYARDWLASSGVALLSLDERGAYITLLARCWMMGALPLDPRQLAMLAGASPQWWKQHASKVLEHFVRTEGGYRNERLDAEREKQASFREKQSNAGKASAERRLNHGATPVEPRLNHGSTLHLPSSSALEEVPPTPKGAIVAKRLTVEELFGPSDSKPSPEADLITKVMDLWATCWAEMRGGALYKPHPVRDYAVFQELATNYGDNLPLLETMFQAWAGAPLADLPQWARSKSPKCFLKLAPEMDAQLRRPS